MSNKKCELCGEEIRTVNSNKRKYCINCGLGKIKAPRGLIKDSTYIDFKKIENDVIKISKEIDS